MTIKELKKYLDLFDENLPVKIDYDSPCEGINCHMLLEITGIQECKFDKNNGGHYIEIQHWD